MAAGETVRHLPSRGDRHLRPAARSVGTESCEVVENACLGHGSITEMSECSPEWSQTTNCATGRCYHAFDPDAPGTPAPP